MAERGSQSVNEMIRKRVCARVGHSGVDEDVAKGEGGCWRHRGWWMGATSGLERRRGRTGTLFGASTSTAAAIFLVTKLSEV
jgi:hypothetical protein